MKLGYTIAYVSDVAESIAFYEHAFGLKRRFIHESGQYGELETGGPLVVSCGNQRRQSVVVVAPCGHVGKSQSGLSTCPCGLVVHELEAVS